MRNRSGKVVKQFRFKGFENVEFGAEEQDQVIAWLAKTNFDPIDCITTLVEALYKVGFSYDEFSQINITALTCKDPESRYYGYCFIFKHAEILRGVQMARFVYDGQLKDQLYSLGLVSKSYDW